MHVSPINNYSNQQIKRTNPQFKARFTETQLRKFLEPYDRLGNKKNMYEFVP